MPIDLNHWPSKVANVVVYVALLSGNLYSTFGTDKDQESPYHSQHQSYVTPAAFTFYVWMLIDTLLGGMVIYQWFTDKVYLATSWHFVVASVMNAAWLALWENGPSTFQLVLAVVGLGFVSSTVIGYIEYKQGDVAGALVLAWYLFGVFDHQQAPAIHWTALGLGIGVSAYTLKPFLYRLVGRSTGGEGAPLLGREDV
ncbi:hypothetical protein BGZ94_007929 [Podila epigama]|nr:hypothetical protein BGZ94_007929 [Podila epigama]